ncbi:hypothetical protein OF83DRAFT_697432 [Amylostereum chailletii]|nr:hypothetical protein OF83DRAFT_697432 [Amylostereum chailletii]
MSDIAAHVVIICAQNEPTEESPDILAPFLRILVKAVAAAKSKHRSIEEARTNYRNFQKDGWRYWYPAMKALRDMPLAAKMQHQKVVEAWVKFGVELRIDEDEARKFHSQKPIAIPTPSQICCSWKECIFHTYSPPDAMRQCVGCREVSYCDKECQARDWKEGGHKKKCRRLTAA